METQPFKADEGRFKHALVYTKTGQMKSKIPVLYFSAHQPVLSAHPLFDQL